MGTQAIRGKTMAKLRPDLYAYRTMRRTFLSQCKFWRNLGGDGRRQSVRTALLARRRYLVGDRRAEIWDIAK